MRTSYKTGLLLLLLLSSCASPRLVTKLSPEAPEGHFAMGREYIPLESEELVVELGFDGMQGDQLVFDLVVHNSSSDTLSIVTSGFYYVLLDSAHAESAQEASWESLHPDTVMAYYDLSIENREKQKEMNTMLGILQAGVNILYNASGFIATEDPGFIVDAVFQTAGTADEYISNNRMISMEMTEIREEKELVREEIFRDMMLPPDQVASGFVYFPSNLEAAYYMFCFPLGKQLFQYVYRQDRELVY